MMRSRPPLHLPASALNRSPTGSARGRGRRCLALSVGKRLNAPRGVVLVVVLVVIVILALGAYTFSELMLTEREATEYAGRQAQARLLVDSGVDSLRYFLMQDKLTQAELGGHYNNPAAFQAQVVADDADPNFRGCFTVLAPMLDDQGYPGGLRYGLENESARVNINALVFMEKAVANVPGMENAARDLLMALPNMTEEIADAILDYIDEDSEPREFGAEDEVYLERSPPYTAKNGLLDSVEELLLVQGVTPQLLFGADVNRNGILDPNEATDAALAESPDGAMDRGWSAYLTLWSMERNYNAAGQPRIFINQDDLQQLAEQLTAAGFEESWVNFIIAFRQYGPAENTGTDSGDDTGSDEIPPVDPASARPAENGKLRQVIDLIGARVRIPGDNGEGNGEGDEDEDEDEDEDGGGRGGGGQGGGGQDGGGQGGGGQGGGGQGGDNEDQGTVYNSPFTNDLAAMAAYLPILLDQVSVNPNAWYPGRVNVNHAPRAILVGIPGMSEEIADEIIANRQMEGAADGESTGQEFETWLLTSGIVTLEEMKLLIPFITAGGDVYRAQVVGYFEDGGASARAEVVIDATQSTPRILFWRDITHLGRGYALDMLGVAPGSAY